MVFYTAIKRVSVKTGKKVAIDYSCFPVYSRSLLTRASCWLILGKFCRHFDLNSFYSCIAVLDISKEFYVAYAQFFCVEHFLRFGRDELKFISGT